MTTDPLPEVLPTDPEELIALARETFDPIASVCLFSGGNDSTVLAHRCRDHYEQLAFIDTGTAVPGVLEFVEEFAAWVRKPLVVLRADDAYRRLVLGSESQQALGFPGPGQHHRAYQRLKERQLRALTKRLKHGRHRYSKVLMLSGIRWAESSRRGERVPITRDGARVFVNPLIAWSNAEMRDYRREHGVPQSDVAALLHRSGECNCGAFAAPGERQMLEQLYPGWFDETIASLERECVARGIRACRWGERPPKEGERIEAGVLCSDCVGRIGGVS